MRIVDYLMQFNVISYSPRGEPLEVCFHGPGRRGFSSVDTAQEIIANFEAMDKILNRTRIYEIVPCAVASDHECFLEVPPSDESELSDLINELTIKPPTGTEQSN